MLEEWLLAEFLMGLSILSECRLHIIHLQDPGKQISNMKFNISTKVIICYKLRKHSARREPGKLMHATVGIALHFSVSRSFQERSRNLLILIQSFSKFKEKSLLGKNLFLGIDFRQINPA